MNPRALNTVVVIKCIKDELLIFSTVNTQLIND